MEDESLHHQSQETVIFPVKDMESVVATVSGYHGSERFNLIKMISMAGASYVGNMNQSTTHLVCWKFEGRKYELAKKLKMAIVNHRWIVECVKKECRVSESPFTIKCGQEVGTACLDIPLEFNKVITQSKPSKISKEPVIDIEIEELNNGSRTDFSLLNEGNEPKNSEPVHFHTLKKRNSTSSEPHCKPRRLVKKHLSTKDLTSTSKGKEDCPKVKVIPENYGGEIPTTSSEVERYQFAPNRHTSDLRCSANLQRNIDPLDDVEEIEILSDENGNDCVQGVASSLKNKEPCCEVVHRDFMESDPRNRLLSTSELSCVICFTDFSSTRGVLPCGHRFCFDCIQNWADHLASRKKSSTCPLCKTGFICISKVEDAASADQKIYSQTIPSGRSKEDVYILPDETYTLPAYASSRQVCFRCFSREPEDLLVRCQYCQIRCVHSYCLDPPLFPWSCVHCNDLQMLYLHSR